jgi:2-C-methyl-D-erythritol 4-phosphate cytidylyltransferase/2-C-methyl-D-erythritol 2,4-cyclodiphosphate synthase
VEIAHDETLIGHSDADAGLHALTDAILGAIGEGDIGDHFPPTDPQWKGAASDQFLIHAVDLVAAKRRGDLVNVDVTLICERPKIKPHRAGDARALAEILDLPLDRVSVKATTTEKMGFTGRGEGRKWPGGDQAGRPGACRPPWRPSPARPRRCGRVRAAAPSGPTDRWG